MRVCEGTCDAVRKLALGFPCFYAEFRTAQSESSKRDRNMVHSSAFSIAQSD
jgi:hypothetical protein